MSEPADGSHRLWTNIGTQFVSPSTKAEWENLYHRCGRDAQGRHCSSFKWKQQGQDAVEGKRRQGEMRRLLRPILRDKNERRKAVRQELCKAHRKSPIFALLEALRELDTKEAADSSAGSRS